MTKSTLARPVSFNVTRAEKRLIDQIVARALNTTLAVEWDLDQVSLTMDITATHANGCRLRLAELADAEPFDFAHDVFGIVKHIDHTTGELKRCFVPRFAAAEGRNG